MNQTTTKRRRQPTKQTHVRTYKRFINAVRREQRCDEAEVPAEQRVVEHTCRRGVEVLWVRRHFPVHQPFDLVVQRGHFVELDFFHEVLADDVPEEAAAQLEVLRRVVDEQLRACTEEGVASPER